AVNLMPARIETQQAVLQRARRAVTDNDAVVRDAAVNQDQRVVLAQLPGAGVAALAAFQPEPAVPVAQPEWVRCCQHACQPVRGAARPGWQPGHTAACAPEELPPLGREGVEEDPVAGRVAQGQGLGPLVILREGGLGLDPAQRCQFGDHRDVAAAPVQQVLRDVALEQVQLGRAEAQRGPVPLGVATGPLKAQQLIELQAAADLGAADVRAEPAQPDVNVGCTQGEYINRGA